MAVEVITNIDLNLGQNLWGKSVEELQAIYDANMRYIQEHNGEYNMGPNLMKELKLYIEFKRSGGIAWVLYCAMNRKGHFFGSLKVSQKYNDYYQRGLDL